MCMKSPRISQKMVSLPLQNKYSCMNVSALSNVWYPAVMNSPGEVSNVGNLVKNCGGIAIIGGSTNVNAFRRFGFSEYIQDSSGIFCDSHFPEKHGQFCPRITIFEIFLKLNPMKIKLVKIASKYKMNKNLSNDTQNVGLQEYLGLYKIFLKKF